MKETEGNRRGKRSINDGGRREMYMRLKASAFFFSSFILLYLYLWIQRRLLSFSFFFLFSGGSGSFGPEMKRHEKARDIYNLLASLGVIDVNLG